MTKNKIMLDYVRLEQEVREKASLYLEEVTEENLRQFAEAIKDTASSVLENFYFAVDKLYAEGACKIEDSASRMKFSDFHDGYRALMKKWEKEHEIEIRELKISPDINVPQYSDIVQNITPVVIGGVGTLVAVGLFIFSELWIAVVAELLTLAAVAYAYNKSNESRNNEYAVRLKKYKIQIQEEKQRLVNGLIVDLKAWLKDAEFYSGEILNQFDVK